MALVRHRATGREEDARDTRADWMRTVAVVAIAAALLAAAYIGWLASWSSAAQPRLAHAPKRPGNHREGK